MTYEHLTILLPCHSLEDFPLHYAGDEAANLLHAWTALWHPALINCVGDIPGWHRADDPPEDIANRLLIIPNTSEPLLLAGWAKRAAKEGGCVVREFSSREEILKEALAALEAPPQVDPELVADFLALGYTYLQEELLTRQMRYMSNLDEPHFREETKAAAAAACSGDTTEARSKLQACFDVLAEARDRFYPVDAYFVDLVLLAESTKPADIVRELESGFATNLLAPANVLEKLVSDTSDQGHHLRSLLQESVKEGRCTVVGGDLDEDLLPLEPVEMTVSRLRLAAEKYQQLLGIAPQVFARRRFGLTPTLPQTLARCGFKAALHFTLDDGQFPRGEQARCRWRGPAPAGIDALTRIPLNASSPETYVGLCERIGETMDLDHVATLVFARWPGQELPWFADLHRAQKYAPVLGRFVTLGEYFGVDASTPTSNFSSDRYRAPYLRQAVIRGDEQPVSSVANATLARNAAEELHTLAVMRQLLDNSTDSQRQLQLAKEQLNAIDSAGLTANTKGQDASGSCNAETASAGLDQSWPRPKGDQPADAERANAGVMVFNPHSASRRTVVDVSALATLPASGGESPVLTVQPEPPLALVEVPPLGYAWVSTGNGQAPEAPVPKRGWFRRKSQENPPLADEETLTLRNEFAEVKIDPHTGGIRAISDYKHRGTRLSQQIALRRKGEKAQHEDDDFGGPRDDGQYSVMSADEVTVTCSGAVRGEIVSRGALLDRDGNRFAGFEQTTRVNRGIPVIELSIKLEIEEEPRSDPWNSYYCCRFAWPDAGLIWQRNVGLFARETELKRFEAPLFVEADTGHQRTAIYCGGLPYHRVIDERILDTMLACRGDTRRDFRLGIALDAKSPVRDALGFLAGDSHHVSKLGPPNGPTKGWLFHIDTPHVIATHWDVITEDDQVVGFRVRLIETAERSVRTKLRAIRKLKSARAVDFTGSPLSELTVEDDTVLLELDGCEWVEVEARWS